MQIDVRTILDAAAYHEVEIDRVLDKDNPSFLEFDPVLGYVMHDHAFNDGAGNALTTYRFESDSNHRKLINHADHPCRVNTYSDSFTMCAQVNDGETWQEYLAANIGEPIRNYGVGGYGVYQAYRKAMRVEDTAHAAEYIILTSGKTTTCATSMRRGGTGQAGCVVICLAGRPTAIPYTASPGHMFAMT